MAQGTSRRAVAKDNLAAAQGIEPVRLTGPGIKAPSMPNPRPSITKAIADELGIWARNELTELTDAQHERELMDGAMASVQGDTMDQLELDGGNKWALQGHRIMSAQTISAGMVAARKQQIEDADYALDPEQFREKFVNELEVIVKGQDPRTARMIREQMAAQMPGLVADHTLAHTKFLERQNYDAVLRSVDIMSRDVQSLDALVLLAVGGEGSPSEGLSASRRSSAVTEGVVLAFRNDNPKAYGLLRTAGVIKEYSTDEINRMEGAKTHYETRLRNEYNERFFSEESRIRAETKAGNMTEWEAVEATEKNLTQRGIDFTAMDARTAYDAALDPQRTMGITRAAAMETATLREDWQALGAASVSIIRKIESNNDPYAIGPEIEFGANAGTNANGEMQVTDATLDQPGWNIKPSNGSREDDARVGVDYWIMNVGRANGDLEAAAIGYHAGPGNMDVWLKSGRNYDALPQPSASRDYWKKFQKEQANQEFPLAAQKYNEGQHQLALAKTAFAVDNWANAAPILNGLDKSFREGKMTEEVWRETRDAVYKEHGIIETQAMINHEIAVVNSILAAVSKDAKSAQASARKDGDKLLKVLRAEQLAERMVQPMQMYFDLLADETLSEAEMAQGMAAINQIRNQIIAEIGIPVVDSGIAGFIEATHTQYKGALALHRKEAEDLAIRQNRTRSNTVSSLTPDEQHTAFDEEVNRRVTPLINNFNASGPGDDVGILDREDPVAKFEQDRDEAVMWAHSQLGMVDTRVRDQESAIVQSRLVDKDGVANPSIVETVRRYNRMVEIDPGVARGYLTDDARTIVNAINKQAGRFGSVEEALVDMGFSPAKKALQNAFLESAAMQKAVAEVVDNHQEFRDTSGLFQMQALFTSSADRGDDLLVTPSEKVRAASEDTRTAVEAGLTVELLKLTRRHLDLKPRLLAETAMQNLERHSAIIGGAFVNLKVDIKAEMFGDLVNKYDKANVEHLAVLALLQTPEMQERYQFLNQVGLAETLPAFAQDVISDSAFGLIGDFSAGMALHESRFVDNRNVRPYKGLVDASGRLYVEVFMPNGTSSEPILIVLKDAGAAFMAKYPLF